MFNTNFLSENEAKYGTVLRMFMRIYQHDPFIMCNFNYATYVHVYFVRMYVGIRRHCAGQRRIICIHAYVYAYIFILSPMDGLVLLQ